MRCLAPASSCSPPSRILGESALASFLFLLADMFVSDAAPRRDGKLSTRQPAWAFLPCHLQLPVAVAVVPQKFLNYAHICCFILQSLVAPEMVFGWKCYKGTRDEKKRPPGVSSRMRKQAPSSCCATNLCSTLAGCLGFVWGESYFTLEFMPVPISIYLFIFLRT